MKVSTKGLSSRIAKKDAPVTKISNVQDLQLQHYHRQAVMDMVKLFEAQVLDIGPDHIVVELTAWQRRVG